MERFLSGRQEFERQPMSDKLGEPLASQVSTERYLRVFPLDMERTVFRRIVPAGEEAAHSWKVSFAFDLPPNLRTGRWRERGSRRARLLSSDSRLFLGVRGYGQNLSHRPHGPFCAAHVTWILGA